MTKSQGRVPKGTPAGGQFSHGRRSEPESASLGEPTDEGVTERWKELLGPRERAHLTRAGVTAEWLVAVEQLNPGRGAGYAYHYLPLIAAKKAGFTPDQAAALFEVCGDREFRGSAEPPWTDSDLLRSLPGGLRPIPFEMVPKLLAPDVDPVAVSIAAQHLPSHQDPESRLQLAIDVAAARITQTEADATGSGDDWWRAHLCRKDGISDADATAWAPLYPINIRSLQDAGWSPGDVDEGNRVVAADWAALGGVTPAVMREWNAAGFHYYHDAFRYLAAGVGPTEAAQWRQIYPAIDQNVATFKKSGVTAADASAAYQAGLAFEPMRCAITIIADIPPDELRQWADALGGRVSAGRITAFRNAGVTTPERAGKWAAALRVSAVDKRETVTPTTLRFINERVDPPDSGGFAVAPIVAATAIELGMDQRDVQRRSEKSAGGLTEGCRAIFRRRRIEPPF